MEKNTIGRRYETRKSTRAGEPVAKSRIDWRRTRQSSRFLDSEDEEDEIVSHSERELETSSEDDADEKEKDISVLSKSKGDTVGSVGTLPGSETGYNGPAAEEVEEENISVGKRKRSRTSVMYDSDESDGSDIVRKVFAKRSCIVDDEDLANEQEQHKSPAEAAASRKQTRLTKLQELCQRRSRQSCTISECSEDSEDDVGTLDDSCQAPFSQAETNDTSDGDSMKDFIVEEEEGDELPPEDPEDERKTPEKRQLMSSTLLEKHIPCLSRVDHFVHFQRVVKAFLINAIDDAFLISLYEGERQKRYAKDMLTSLHYLDDRFIQPRLGNLLARSRWKERYKERVDSYPNIHVTLRNTVLRSCEACELQRYCTFQVTLSGKLYNDKTLEADDFMSQDKQVLKVGVVCGNRTKVYHNLKHFKYKLYKNCCSVMKNEESQNEPVKDTVDRVFSRLDDGGWIQKQYTTLEDYMDSADYFQDEKMD